MRSIGQVMRRRVASLKKRLAYLEQRIQAAELASRDLSFDKAEAAALAWAAALAEAQLEPRTAPPASAVELLRGIVGAARRAIATTRNADGEVYIVDVDPWDTLELAIRALDVAEGRIAADEETPF